MDISVFICRDTNNFIDKEKSLSKFNDFIKNYTISHNDETQLIKNCIYNCLNEHGKKDLFFIKSYVCKKLNVQYENFTYFNSKIEEIILNNLSIIKGKHKTITVYYIKENCND